MKRIEKHEHDNTLLRRKLKELNTEMDQAEEARKPGVSQPPLHHAWTPTTDLFITVPLRPQPPDALRHSANAERARQASETVHRQ